MFGWISRFFSTQEPLVLETPVEKPKKTKTKKAAKKVDLDSMKKDELLAHAKKNGVKANASMKKADLIKAIKNG